MFWLIFIALLVLTALAFVWILHMLLTKACPDCEDSDLVLPVIPGFRAWCPSCNNIFHQSDLVERGDGPRGPAEPEGIDEDYSMAPVDSAYQLPVPPAPPPDPHEGPPTF